MHSTTDRRSGVETRGWSPRTWTLGALALGAASALAAAGISTFATLTDVPDDDLTFHHAADSWRAAVGLPTAIAGAVLLFAVWGLQPTARPALTRAGAVLNAAALAVLSLILTASVITGSEVRWGPAYPLAALATFVGHGLFVAGTWHTGRFPRPLLAVWPVVWLLGSFAAQGASPLVLAAFYALMAGVVVRRP